MTSEPPCQFLWTSFVFACASEQPGMLFCTYLLQFAVLPCVITAGTTKKAVQITMNKVIHMTEGL